jgi:hypothetical protein
MVTIELSNGKKVGNFSSPHPFTFEDGSILPAVSPEEAERLAVTFFEQPIGGLTGRNGDIKLAFSLSKDVYNHIDKWLELAKHGLVDVVYVPLPMMTAMHQEFTPHFIHQSPFRTIRMTDRILKQVSISKQCL